MIGLLTRGTRELLLQRRVGGGQTLCVVQRLRTDFADMIHTHQRTGEATLP